MSTSEVTLRDYFAAHAPAEIPDWFKHIEPKKTFPSMPNYRELDPAHWIIVLDWQRDQCFDLPEELAWYGDKVNKHRQGRRDWEEANQAARYVQWRWAHAGLLIAARPGSTR